MIYFPFFSFHSHRPSLSLSFSTSNLAFPTLKFPTFSHHSFPLQFSAFPSTSYDLFPFFLSTPSPCLSLPFSIIPNLTLLTLKFPTFSLYSWYYSSIALFFSSLFPIFSYVLLFPALTFTLSSHSPYLSCYLLSFHSSHCRLFSFSYFHVFPYSFIFLVSITSFLFVFSYLLFFLA